MANGERTATSYLSPRIDKNKIDLYKISTLALSKIRPNRNNVYFVYVESYGVLIHVSISYAIYVMKKEELQLLQEQFNNRDEYLVNSWLRISYRANDD